MMLHRSERRSGLGLATAGCNFPALAPPAPPTGATFGGWSPPLGLLPVLVLVQEVVVLQVLLARLRMTLAGESAQVHRLVPPALKETQFGFGFLDLKVLKGSLLTGHWWRRRARGER